MAAVALPSFIAPIPSLTPQVRRRRFQYPAEATYLQAMRSGHFRLRPGVIADTCHATSTTTKEGPRNTRTQDENHANQATSWLWSRMTGGSPVGRPSVRATAQRGRRRTGCAVRGQPDRARRGGWHPRLRRDRPARGVRRRHRHDAPRSRRRDPRRRTPHAHRPARPAPGTGSGRGRRVTERDKEDTIAYGQSSPAATADAKCCAGQTSIPSSERNERGPV